MTRIIATILMIIIPIIKLVFVTWYITFWNFTYCTSIFNKNIDLWLRMLAQEEI